MNDTPDGLAVEATRDLTDRLLEYVEELRDVKKDLDTQIRHVKRMLAAVRAAEKAGVSESAPMSVLLSEAYAQRDAARNAATEARQERDLMKRTLEGWAKTALANASKPNQADLDTG